MGRGVLRAPNRMCPPPLTSIDSNSVSTLSCGTCTPHAAIMSNPLRNSLSVTFPSKELSRRLKAT